MIIYSLSVHRTPRPSSVIIFISTSFCQLQKSSPFWPWLWSVEMETVSLRASLCDCPAVWVMTAKHQLYCNWRIIALVKWHAAERNYTVQRDQTTIILQSHWGNRKNWNTIQIQMEQFFFWFFSNSLCYFPQITREETLFLWPDIWFTRTKSRVRCEWERKKYKERERELLTHIYCNIFPSPPLPPFLIDLPLLPQIYF